jgi:hypothetical protein
MSAEDTEGVGGGHRRAETFLEQRSRRFGTVSQANVSLAASRPSL